MGPPTRYPAHEAQGAPRPADRHAQDEDLTALEGAEANWIGGEPRGVQAHIADGDKKARTGSETEPVRNTPPAGDWNDVA